MSSDSEKTPNNRRESFTSQTSTASIFSGGQRKRSIEINVKRKLSLKVLNAKDKKLLEKKMAVVLFKNYNQNSHWNCDFFHVFFSKFIPKIGIQVTLGTIHLRCRHVLGGEGSKICQICRWIVLKNCRRQGGRGQKLVKICRRLKWMVPRTLSLKFQMTRIKIKVSRSCVITLN